MRTICTLYSIVLSLNMTCGSEAWQPLYACATRRSRISVPLPFDKVKIDGSFIKSVESGGQAAAIVRLVLGLGRGLNLPVLAEGVETSAELAFLESEFCNEAQGYLLGKPADIESYRRLTHGGEAFDERSAVIHLKARVKSM
jgi:predicted signal transduction protein with EAL and GGDEF domain